MSESNGQSTRPRRTLVEEGTEVKGTMSSSCPIDVMGRIEGEISGPSIHVTTSGAIAGTIKVEELRSEGELAGSVEAKSVVLSGRVKDDTKIRTEALEVKLGRPGSKMEVVFGECEIAAGDEPSKEAAIAAAMAPPARAEAPAEKVEAPAAEASKAEQTASDEAGVPTTDAASSDTDAVAAGADGDEVQTAEAADAADAADATDAADSDPDGDWDSGDEAQASGDHAGRQGKKKGKRNRRTSGTVPPPV